MGVSNHEISFRTQKIYDCLKENFTFFPDINLIKDEEFKFYKLFQGIDTRLSVLAKLESRLQDFQLTLKKRQANPRHKI